MTPNPEDDVIQPLYGLKCDECGTATSIISTDKEKLIDSEIGNGPWEHRPGGKHACPACVLGMRPPSVRKPKPGVKIRGVNA